MILTAWSQELQNLKIEKVWLTNINTFIVDKSSKKPLALLKYILYELKYIPSKIEIYDDRIEYLCSNAQFLSDLLWIEIIINEVELSWNQVNNMKSYIYLPNKRIDDVEINL